ncbi:MAG: YifB family Mg chelatase-like AAA ATPase [Endozoicomonadaceae bacterium]|nr:YifB family Mg chelatase-like AAA ATPase [Endozoicomonadaceae bacterium]
MSLAVVHTRGRHGIDAPSVTVEVHLSNGLPSLNIVGLLETAVRESKDRVRSAIMNAGFEYPIRRITINLAPADLPKEGGRFDLPIALGILAASGQIPSDSLEQYECLGELALSGEVRFVSAVLPAVIASHKAGRKLIVPQSNANEALLYREAEVFTADSLLAVTGHFTATKPLLPINIMDATTEQHLPTYQDLTELRGQPQARRALEIAATGGHGLLLFGPPGTGKTLLASCMPGILPPLTELEAVEVSAIYSVAGYGFRQYSHLRPFRTPHHSASGVALVGGGSLPKPGEITLAHHGVLFLDELPEFDRRVLEMLRQPLESGTICISRAARQTIFPARFQLLAAMNPCPCGYLGDKTHACSCRPEQIQRYRRKLSGPLLDRIDMHLEVSRLPASELLDTPTDSEESSAVVLARVQSARSCQYARQGKLNSQLATRDLEKHASLKKPEKMRLIDIIERLGLSARAAHRIIRVARTIADLAGTSAITMQHIAEAISFRKLDRTISDSCH